MSDMSPRYPGPPGQAPGQAPGQGSDQMVGGGDGKPPHGQHPHMGGPQPSRTPPSQPKEHRDHREQREHRERDHREPREASKPREQAEKQGTEGQSTRKGRGKRKDYCPQILFYYVP